MATTFVWLDGRIDSVWLDGRILWNKQIWTLLENILWSSECLTIFHYIPWKIFWVHSLLQNSKAASFLTLISYEATALKATFMQDKSFSLCKNYLHLQLKPWHGQHMRKGVPKRRSFILNPNVTMKSVLLIQPFFWQFFLDFLEGLEGEILKEEGSREDNDREREFSREGSSEDDIGKMHSMIHIQILHIRTYWSNTKEKVWGMVWCREGRRRPYGEEGSVGRCVAFRHNYTQARAQCRP